ncbi:GNAT family N-acetyltransferase [Flavobacterium sp. SM2513]|uniref:GNAT family N-acetyltransferase n=1 Tax=Flavobacterium sp. SM2513 TaxID=3424766 RepID=UPI003D7F3306
MNQVKVNSEKNRFELEVESSLAIIDFQKIEPNILDLIHTEVPAALSGKGVGSKLVSGALQYCKDNNLQIIPSCSFVESYIEKHLEWKELVARKKS